MDWGLFALGYIIGIVGGLPTSFLIVMLIRKIRQRRHERYLRNMWRQ